MSNLLKYLAERDEAVKSPLEEFTVWANSKGCNFSSLLVAEMTMHKLRTAINDIPMEMKLASDKWLRDRGYESWMDHK